MRTKKANFLEVGDYIELKDDEHLWVRTVEFTDDMVHIYGFINHCTDGSCRSYKNTEVVKIWEINENPTRKNPRRLNRTLLKFRKLLFGF
ncbi:hypothetical protein GAP32_386 [Cronobacter phage vB_CsaM_GAP32]|uniref:Uncharacterized protein n=1 Tax=Cronobacter phage vB_CsaM_GAP32 TaxID=1141136 RepID=K4F734_9CAUD|nr:hypothetical protein GAP32_386 [Cronobacter phage vB_CsaM_GAP32]AFC21838.1 hypothetical protein GAP32_386 [Cronobacter phage vB_CsaM_GAP32]